jgi:hypothetical protein
VRSGARYAQRDLRSCVPSFFCGHSRQRGGRSWIPHWWDSATTYYTFSDKREDIYNALQRNQHETAKGRGSGLGPVWNHKCLAEPNAYAGNDLSCHQTCPIGDRGLDDRIDQAGKCTQENAKTTAPACAYPTRACRRYNCTTEEQPEHFSLLSGCQSVRFCGGTPFSKIVIEPAGLLEPFQDITPDKAASPGHGQESSSLANVEALRHS